MKEPDTFLTNPVAGTTARPYGAAKDNPGDNSGSGMVSEIYNDPAYAALTVINAFREGGISGNDESEDNPDMLQALLEALGGRVDGVDDWDMATTYSTIGDLVTHKNHQWVSFNNTGNLNKEPAPGSTFWFKVPKKDALIDAYQDGVPFVGGMHPIHDRAGGSYQQNLAFGKFRLGFNGDSFYNAHIVHLDGSVVTGNPTLVSILDVGGANENPFIDIFAPDVLGTRTLIDMGERPVVGQSASGESDTLGELQDDRFQGHWHEITLSSETPNAGAFRVNSVTGAYTGNGFEHIRDAITDTVNGTPRTGPTTRGKQLAGGAPYMIAIIPA